MTSTRQIAFVSALGFLVVLGGCSQAPLSPPPFLQSTAPLALQVHKRTEVHYVELASDGRTAPIERARLDAFIKDLAGNRPDALHVEVSGVRTDAQLRSIKSILVRDGLDPDKITATSTNSGPIGLPVKVSVDSYNVTPPHCDPWNPIYTASADVNANPTGSDLGCSDMTNLGAMVADPHDLIKGSSDPYADGTTAAAAVSRYRTDTIKRLPTEGGFTPGSGTTSSSTGGGAVSTGGQ